MNARLFSSYVLAYNKGVRKQDRIGTHFMFKGYEVKIYSKVLDGFDNRLRLEMHVNRGEKRDAIIKVGIGV